MSLQANGVMTRGFDVLASALRTNTTLRSLQLLFNHSCGTPLAEAVLASASLEVVSCILIMKIKANAPEPVVVDLSEALLLASLLPGNTSLRGVCLAKEKSTICERVDLGNSTYEFRTYLSDKNSALLGSCDHSLK